MSGEIQRKLRTLRSDYLEVTGKPFANFFCPVLFRDEEVPLCRAHILNAAFPNSSRNWTVQRADVDNFFGHAFESDFVDIQYQDQSIAERALGDPTLSRKLRPRIRIDGEEVEHFITTGPIPTHFTEARVEGPSGPVRLGLKIHPDDAPDIARWQIVVEKDIRLAALVSALKAAHLTLFEMLGYRYALSAGGYFLGHDVLGNFFLKNKGKNKADLIVNGLSHFREFANMMRPLLTPPPDLKGTAADQSVFVCRCDGDIPWGIIVFVKTGDLVHSVLVPVLDSESAAARFMTFLRGQGCTIRANRCRLEGQKWFGAKDHELLKWPTAAFEEPVFQEP